MAFTIASYLTKPVWLYVICPSLFSNLSRYRRRPGGTVVSNSPWPSLLLVAKQVNLSAKVAKGRRGKPFPAGREAENARHARHARLVPSLHANGRVRADTRA